MDTTDEPTLQSDTFERFMCGVRLTTHMSGRRQLAGGCPLNGSGITLRAYAFGALACFAGASLANCACLTPIRYVRNAG
jgi:hypothetical protein